MNKKMERWLIQRFGPLQVVDGPTAAALQQGRTAFLVDNDEAEAIASVRNNMAEGGFAHVATIPLAAVEQGKTGSMLVFEKQTVEPVDVSNLWGDLIAETPCDYYRRLAEQFHTVPHAPWYLTPDQIDAMEAARLLALVSADSDVFVAIEERLPTPAAQTWLKERTKQAAVVMVRFWTRQIIRKLAFEFEQEWILPTEFDNGPDPVVAHVYVVKHGLIDEYMRSWNTNAEYRGLIFLCVKGAGQALPSFYHATHHTAIIYQDLPRFKEFHATRPPHRAGGRPEGPRAPHDLPLVSWLPTIDGMLKTLKPLHALSMMMFSSIVLEILGHTVGMDMDFILWNPLEHPDIAALNKKTDDLDVFYWNGKEYVGRFTHTNDWFNKDLPALFGAPNMEEVIYNPRYHFYWRGIKLMSVSATVARLKQRARPAAMADLYALKYRMGLPIELPCLPKSIIFQDGIVRDYTNKKTLEQTYRTTMNYLRVWQDMNVTMSELQKAFPRCPEGGAHLPKTGTKTRKAKHTKSKTHWIVNYPYTYITEPSTKRTTKRKRV